jgi:hypothetical protein
MRQLLSSCASLGARAVLALLMASPAAAQESSEVLFARRLNLSGQLSGVCAEPSSDDQGRASRETRCGKSIARGLADRTSLDRDWLTRHTSVQSSGPSGGAGRKVVAIVAGLAMAGGGIYLVATSRGWAEPDFANPGGLRPCMYTRISDLGQRCYTNRIAIGVPLFITGGGLVAWGFGVP